MMVWLYRVLTRVALCYRLVSALVWKYAFERNELEYTKAISTPALRSDLRVKTNNIRRLLSILWFGAQVVLFSDNYHIPHTYIHTTLHSYKNVIFI